jgi:hypothetical protein
VTKVPNIAQKCPRRLWLTTDKRSLFYGTPPNTLNNPIRIDLDTILDVYCDTKNRTRFVIRIQLARWSHWGEMSFQLLNCRGRDELVCQLASILPKSKFDKANNQRICPGGFASIHQNTNPMHSQTEMSGKQDTPYRSLSNWMHRAKCAASLNSPLLDDGSPNGTSWEV